MSYSDLEREYARISKHYPPMNYEEQLKYVMLAKEGNKEAMDKIILSNMGLIMKIVSNKLKKTNFKYGNLEFEDLFQEGNLGLMHAIQVYSPECGSKFSTYAVWWIERQIKQAMFCESNTIRLPRHVVERIITISGEIEFLKQSLERTPTDEEIARALGSQFDEALVFDTLKLMQLNNIVELDMNLDKEDENGDTVGSLIADTVATPEETAISRDREDILRSAIAELKPREAAAVTIKWGLEDSKEKTLEETARIMAERGMTNREGRQISKQAVDKLESQAIKKLRVKLKNKTDMFDEILENPNTEEE